MSTVSPRGALGTVADLLAVTAAISGAYVFITRKNLPQTVLAITVSGLAITFIAISFRLQRVVVETETRHRRHVQDVKAVSLLSTATAHVARATVVAERPAEFVLHLNNACSDLAQMYDTATGEPCRVTVVELYAPQGKERRPGEAVALDGPYGVAVRLLCASYADRPVRPAIDWVVDNTDFETIFVTGSPYFLCNDLPAEVGKGLKNSHWTRERIADFQASDSWPYRSAIVWPIGSVSSGSGDRDLVGFLCVDSKAVGIFDRDFDVPTGETFAHAMYSGMATYRAVQQRAAQPTKPEARN